MNLLTHLSGKQQRWLVLFLVSIVMMTGYIFWDILSPLSTMLTTPEGQGGYGWTAAEYGFFAGSYSFFNVFLLMLFWGGIILDSMGVRFTGLMATGLMLTGAAVCLFSMEDIAPTSMWQLPLLGETKVQVTLCGLGFGLFGVGCDITGITVSKIITRWFKGYELASAMGIQVALARVGTALAISLSPLVALRHGLTGALKVGVAVLLLGLVLFIAYVIVLDKMGENTPPPLSEGVTTSKADKPNDHNPPLKGEARGVMTTNHSTLLAFLLIVLLCVLFYSSIRPFLKFSTDLLINKFGMDSQTAGWTTSILPYGTILLTPLFGHLYDRIGRGATLMVIGCAITLGCHVLLMRPAVNSMAVAVVVMALLGVAFSLVPSAMWASIPQIVPFRRLGIAYGIIFYIQNLGLMFVPIWVGKSIDAHTLLAPDGSKAVDYVQPMSIFVVLSLLAVVVSLLLRIVDRRFRIGLEQPNISGKSSAE